MKQNIKNDFFISIGIIHPDVFCDCDFVLKGPWFKDRITSSINDVPIGFLFGVWFYYYATIAWLVKTIMDGNTSISKILNLLSWHHPKKSSI